MDTQHLGKPSALPASPGGSGARLCAQPAGRRALSGAVCGARVHLAVPGHRPARFRASGDRLCARARRSSRCKSLKLFLGIFRNHCGFHEDVTVGIGQRLVEEMKPQWLRIGGYWYPRGGMPIDVFWQSGAAARRPVAARPGRRSPIAAGASDAPRSRSWRRLGRLLHRRRVAGRGTAGHLHRPAEALQRTSPSTG